MAYVLKREPVRYTDGKMSPVFYYKGTGLRLMFVEVTENIEEATKVRTNKEAAQVLQDIDKRYHIVKI